MTKRSQASVVAAVIVLVVVAVALRSCSPSRSVGRSAVNEACFAFSRAVQLPNGEPAYRVFERARDAATRSADPTLAADVSHAVSTYGEDGNGAPLSHQLVDSALAQCNADGWTMTDRCTYGAAICPTPTTPT